MPDLQSRGRRSAADDMVRPRAKTRDGRTSPTRVPIVLVNPTRRIVRRVDNYQSGLGTDRRFNS